MLRMVEEPSGLPLVWLLVGRAADSHSGWLQDEGIGCWGLFFFFTLFGFVVARWILPDKRHFNGLLASQCMYVLVSII